MPGTKVSEPLRRQQIINAAFELAIDGGLNAITIRDVAQRAEMSSGLVIFHFGTKDQLVLALLEWVLQTTTALSVGPDIEAIGDPLERLIALLRQEMARLSREPQRIRLFFEFWSAGIWNSEIGNRMQRELDRYREAFRPMAEAVLLADPARFEGVSAAGLTAVTVSFIKGCAVQAMIEPQLDIREFLAAAEGLLVKQLHPTPPTGRPSASRGPRILPARVR
ncbi:MAG: TetR family transcriptional regulator [bacterium]